MAFGVPQNTNRVHVLVAAKFVFDDRSFPEKLRNLRDSVEAAQTLSPWCISASGGASYFAYPELARNGKSRHTLPLLEL